MRILVLASRFPYPLEKGDKLRMYWHIRSLAQHHEIHLCCISHKVVAESDQDHLSQFCKSIHILPISKIDLVGQIIGGLLKGIPLSVAYFTNRKAQRAIHRLIESEQYDGLYCQLIRMVEYTHHFSQYKAIDYMDAFSEIMRKRAELFPLLLKKLLHWEARKLKQYEQKTLSKFDDHLFISRRDADCIQPNLHKSKILSNGIDIRFFTDVEGRFDQEFDIGFIGNMGYHPNVDAAHRLIKNILPNLSKNTTVLLAGARPHQSIQNLSSKNVFVSGWIEDIRIAYKSIKIFVAPIELGGGQQNKVLEALAMGVPCVISNQTAAGLDPSIKKFVSIASSEQEFVDFINHTLKHYSAAKNQAKEAQLYLEKAYNWDSINQPLINLFQNIVQYS